MGLAAESLQKKKFQLAVWHVFASNIHTTEINYNFLQFHFFKSMQVYFKEIMTPTLWTILVSIPVAESGPSVIVDTVTYMGIVVFHTRKGDL